MHRSPPPGDVVAAFGADAVVEPIDGGRGTAWSAGGLILKPLDMSADALRWQAEVLTPLAGRTDLRVAPPLRAGDGRLSVDGWTAWPRLDGTSGAGAWDRILEAGRLFSVLTSDIVRPSFLDTTTGPWAEADRIAWGERSPDPVSGARFVSELLGLLRPWDSGGAGGARGAGSSGASSAPGVSDGSGARSGPWSQHESRAQLVHGDLTGNVLFAEGQPPAVIDISPYWRPPAYATAVVLVDALTWEHAAVEWAVSHLSDAVHRQAFVRALLFRIVTDHIARPGHPIADAYEPAVDLARRLAG